MKIRFLFLIIALFLFGAYKTDAQEELEDFDFSQIEEFIENNLADDEPSFTEIIRNIIKDPGSLRPDEIAKQIWDSLLKEVNKNKETGLIIIALSVCAAVFSSIAGVFKNGQAAANAWLVVYLMMTSALLSGFIKSYELTGHYLGLIITFMRLLMPAFCMSMICISGAASSSLYYQAAFGCIGIIDMMLSYLIMPMVQAYFCIALLNELTDEEYFDGLLELLKAVFEWIMKTMTALIVGLQIIQGLILPALSRTKGSIVQKAINAIPVVGNGIKSTTEILLGTGVLIKNGIGAAGCIVLAALAFFPIIQLSAIALIYYITAAVTGPVSDKRITACLEASAYSNRQLLKILAAAIFMFVITIAAICSCTDRII